MPPKQKTSEKRKKQNRDAQQRFRKKIKDQRDGWSLFRTFQEWLIILLALKQGEASNVTAKITQSHTSPQDQALLFPISPIAPVGESTLEQTVNPFSLGLGSSPRGTSALEDTSMEMTQPSILSTAALQSQDMPSLGATRQSQDYDLAYLIWKRGGEYRLLADKTNLEIEKLKLAGRQRKRQIEVERTQLEIERLEAGMPKE